MLPDRITQLLSAYVDGELNSRERRNVGRILRKSPEARQLLSQLKQDSMILRRLPRKKTQIDLTGSAMGTISLRGIKLPKIDTTPIALLHPPPPRKRRPRWLAAVISMLALLAIGAVSYLLFSLAISYGLVGPNGDEPPTTGSVPLPPVPGSGQTDRPPPAVAVLHEPDNPTPAPKGVNPWKDERYGLGAARVPDFVAARPRLPAILPMRDLELPPGAAQVVQELKSDTASRLDLFCTGDTSGALDRLKAAMEANGATLRLDGYAQARLKQKLKTNYVVYCQDLAPSEWKNILTQLVRDDKKPFVFDKLTIHSVTGAEMARILGGEPANYSQDPSAHTGSQIVQKLSGDRTTRPEPETVSAVAVPYLPNPVFSREVRHIVENPRLQRERNGERAVQVMLILWGGN